MADTILWSDPDTIIPPSREDGKFLHWTTDIKDDLPIKMSSAPGASIPPTTFPNMFKKTLETHAQKPALRYKENGTWVTWTFQDYYNDAKKFAASLIHFGLSPKSVTNIIGFNSPQWVIGFAGSLLIGCIPVGVYSTNKQDTCEYIANHSEAELVLVSNEIHLQKYLNLLDNGPKIKAAVVYWPGPNFEVIRAGRSNIFKWDEFLAMNSESEQLEAENRIEKVKPTQCATLIYTSGTTGSPKGVILSHDNITWFNNPNFPFEIRLVSYLPLSHVAAMKIDICFAISSKVFVTFADENALKGSLLQTLRETRPVVFFGVPRVYEKFEEYLKKFESSVSNSYRSIIEWAKSIGFEGYLNQVNKKQIDYKFVIAKILVYNVFRVKLGLHKTIGLVIGAAPTSKSTIDYFYSLNMPIQNGYGLSETSSASTLSNFANVNPDCIGSPTSGTTIIIKDAQGNILGPNEKGEICNKGRNQFMGYYKDEDSTKNAIDREGFFHTGDEGYINEEGLIFISGRIKEILITAGGENIPFVLIENNIKENCEIISNALLIGDKKQFLAVLITLKSLMNSDGTFSSRLTQESVSFLKNIGINAECVEELEKDQRFLQYIQGVIDRTNEKAISRAQEIRKFKVLPNDFSVAGGELTESIKTKRNYIIEKYSSIIQDIYNS